MGTADIPDKRGLLMIMLNVITSDVHDSRGQVPRVQGGELPHPQGAEGAFAEGGHLRLRLRHLKGEVVEKV